MLDVEQVETEATNWFVRLQHRPAADVARKDFARWLLASPRHVQAYLAVVRAWGSIGLVEQPPTEVLVRAAREETQRSCAPHRREEPAGAIRRPTGSKEPPPRRRSFGQWMQLGAAAAAAALIFAFGRFTADLPAQSNRVMTAVGEQRNVKLPDGSLVQVNTASELTFDLTGQERRVVLERGEARFTVTKDPSRPFVVVTPRTTLRVLGTVFNVNIANGETAVAVFEGRVEVRGTAVGADTQPVTALVLQKGEQALMTPQGELRRDVGSLVDRMRAWPERRLIFRDDTVADVVAEFNRYNAQPIRIADPALAGMKITGSFEADDRASLIRYLEDFESVHSSMSPDGSYVLLSEPAAQAAVER